MTYKVLSEFCKLLWCLQPLCLFTFVCWSCSVQSSLSCGWVDQRVVHICITFSQTRPSSPFLSWFHFLQSERVGGHSFKERLRDRWRKECRRKSFFFYVSLRLPLFTLRLSTRTFYTFTFFYFGKDINLPQHIRTAALPLALTRLSCECLWVCLVLRLISNLMNVHTPS